MLDNSGRETANMIANSGDTQGPLRRKRVLAACDYCRAKRLKCTAEQRPCMNCQLYGAECKDSRDHKATRVLSAKKRIRKQTPVQQALIERLPSTGSPLADPDTIVVERQQLPYTSQTLDIAGTLSEVGMSHNVLDQAPNRSQHGNGLFAPADVPVSGALSTHDLHRLPVQTDFNQTIDYWDPTVSIHDSIFLGGLLDTSSYSQISPLDGVDHLSGIEDGASNPAARDAQISQVRTAQERELSLPQAVSNMQRRTGKVSGVQSFKQHTEIAKHTRILPGLFIRKNATDSNFIGLHSVGATLAFCIRESLETAEAPSWKNSPLTYLIDGGSLVDEVGVLQMADASKQHLPSQAFAASSIKAFFKHVYTFYPVLDEQAFRSTWPKHYSQAHSGRSLCDHLSLCLVIAIGALADKNLNDTAFPPEGLAESLFQQTWSLQQDLLGRPSIDTIQILLLQVIYLMYRGRAGFAWVVCGTIVRVAQAIGLHRRSPRDFDLTESQISLRSRLWWVTFGLDAALSISQGRPTAATDSNNDAELLPLTVHSEEPVTVQTAIANLYLWKIGLAKIQNKLSNLLCRHEPVIARLDALADLDAALIMWRDDIALECRPEQEILVHHDVYHLIGLLHLEYFSVLRTLHWGSTTSSPANDHAIESHSSHRIRACETMCLSAGRSFIKVLNDVIDECEPNTVFAIRLHTYDYLAALAILYRNICKNPRKTSAKADLEFFRAGKAHLERDFPGYDQYTSLSMLFNEMLATAEGKVYQHDSFAGL